LKPSSSWSEASHSTCLPTFAAPISFVIKAGPTETQKPAFSMLSGFQTTYQASSAPLKPPFSWLEASH